MHRSHRSKRGRKPRGRDWEFVKDFKRVKLEKIEKEIIRENLNKYINEQKSKIF